MTGMQLKDGRRQLSLRLNPETVAAIDARRGDLSRDAWFQRMADYCLSLPKNTTEETRHE